MPIYPVPGMTREQIRDVAEELYRKYLRAVGRDRLARDGISFDTLYDEVIYPEYEVRLDETCDLGFDARGKKIIGLFDVRGNAAFIDRSLRNDPRRTFTRYHETVGHGVLQGGYLREYFDKATITLADDGHRGFLNRIERQANVCASYAAAPPPLIAYSLEAALGISRKRPLDFIPCRHFSLTHFGREKSYQVETFEELCRVLASIIQPKFDGLSVEALSYRVAALSSVVRNHTPPPRPQLRRAG